MEKKKHYRIQFNKSFFLRLGRELAGTHSWKRTLLMLTDPQEFDMYTIGTVSICHIFCRLIKKPYVLRVSICHIL